MGDGSTATSLWHQDAKSVGKACYHFPRFLGFYFPHEVDSLMGPTRFLKASYCDNGLILTVKYISPSVFKRAPISRSFRHRSCRFSKRLRNRSFHAQVRFCPNKLSFHPSWDNQSSELPFVEAETSRDLLYRPTVHFIWNRLLGNSNVKLVQEELAVHDSVNAARAISALDLFMMREEVLLPKTA